MAGSLEALRPAWLLIWLRVTLSTGTWVLGPTQAERACSDSSRFAIKPFASQIWAAHFFSQGSSYPDHRPLQTIFRSAEDGKHAGGQTTARTQGWADRLGSPDESWLPRTIRNGTAENPLQPPAGRATRAVGGEGSGLRNKRPRLWSQLG